MSALEIVVSSGKYAHWARDGAALCGRPITRATNRSSYGEACVACAAILAGSVTAATLANQSEATYRQIDHWTRLGLLRCTSHKAPGSGTTRTYAPGELDVVRVMAILCAAGLTPPTAERLARQRSIELAGGITIGIGVAA